MEQPGRLSGLLHVIFSSPPKESIYNSLIYISSTAPEVSFSRQQFGGDDERKFRRPASQHGVVSALLDAGTRKPPRRRWILGYTDTLRFGYYRFTDTALSHRIP